MYNFFNVTKTFSCRLYLMHCFHVKRVGILVPALTFRFPCEPLNKTPVSQFVLSLCRYTYLINNYQIMGTSKRY